MNGRADFQLWRWRIIEVDSGEHHLVGFAVALESYAQGRVSSAIRAFDPLTKIVTTRSGNRYELVGPKGRDVEAEWVLEHWLWWNSATIFNDDCEVDELCVNDDA